MSGHLLIYGATGYTGTLIAERAVAAGLDAILAGRSEAKVRPLAERLGLSWLAFSLADQEALDAAVADAGAVLHIAGPYSKTGTPMVDACLRCGTHYIDICGEVEILEDLAKRDDEAKASNIMVLAGAGFDVVPSDCLIAHVTARLPDADTIVLSIGGITIFSRGTTRTLMESVALGTRVRRDGAIIELPEVPRATCDFGTGERPTVGVGWGDVATAWWSARTPNIAVYFESTPMLEQVASTPKSVSRLLATDMGQWFLNKQIDRQPAGPSPEERATLRTTLVVEASDAAGKRAVSRLYAGEGYSLTAATAVEIARRVLGGELRAGYQTPAAMYGPDLILGMPGVTRENVL